MARPIPSLAFRRSRERASGLLFAFGVDDLSTTLTTGQTLTLTRATGRTVYDSTGRVTSLVHSQTPWSAFYNSTDAIWEPTLDVAPAATNLCLRSEDFSSGWTSIGTPTRTAAAATIGDVVLDLIGDDASGTLEGYSRTISFTGNAVKACSVFVKQGTSTTSAVRLRDATAGANRLLAVLTWSGGAPSVAMTTGTYIGADPCNGGYRLRFQSTSVTAANTNQIEVYPATNSSLATTQTGTLYVGGVQLQNAVAPGPYVKTLGSTATSDADMVSTPVAVPVADFTVYMRIARPAWAGLSSGWPGNFTLFGQEFAATNAYWQIYFDPINQQIRSAVGQAGSGQTAPASIPATAAIDVCAQFVDLTTAPRTRIDVGGGFSAYSSTVAAMSAWDDTTVFLGGDTSGTAGAGIRKAVIASGARTLAEMRGLNV